jgi:hypothetical protein
MRRIITVALFAVGQPYSVLASDGITELHALSKARHSWEPHGYECRFVSEGDKEFNDPLVGAEKKGRLGMRLERDGFTLDRSRYHLVYCRHRVNQRLTWVYTDKASGKSFDVSVGIR